MSKVDEYTNTVPDIPTISLGRVSAEITRMGGLTLVSTEGVMCLQKEQAMELSKFLATWYLDEAPNAQ